MSFAQSCFALATVFALTPWLAAEGLDDGTNSAAWEAQIIAAATTAPAPHFNGASLVGLHPGDPLVYALPVSGERPLSFSVRHLPVGLQLDPVSGIITGTLAKPGEYPVSIQIKNAFGTANAQIKIIAGPQLALTPPLGWNSYDTYGDSVTEAETLANAGWMAERLQPFGWDTIVVDFRWYDPHPTGNDYLLNSTRTGAQLAADSLGRLLPAPDRFPSAAAGAGFQPLADRLHSLGLKFGIHVMRGIPRQAVLAGVKIGEGDFSATDAADTNDLCPWCPDMYGVRANAAGQAWYDSCARLWASWGVDYIKVDDLSEPYHAAEIAMIHRAIANVGHSIVFSTSPGPTSPTHAADIAANANLWRISGDFWDRWSKLNHQFDLLAEWQGVAGRGHWPDADMIPLGQLAIRSKIDGDPHWTHFTREEQLTLISLWSLAPSPMMLGMNLPDNDDWTAALLTNPEVLALDQDSLGQPAKRVRRGDAGTPEVWVRELAGGAQAVGLFNRTDGVINATCDWEKLGLPKSPALRDLWLHKELLRQPVFSTVIPPHGCCLLRLD
jgi:hypothetical protein